MITSTAGTVVVMAVKLAIALTSTTAISYMVSKFNSYEYKPTNKGRGIRNEPDNIKNLRNRERGI